MENVCDVDAEFRIRNWGLAKWEADFEIVKIPIWSYTQSYSM